MAQEGQARIHELLDGLAGATEAQYVRDSGGSIVDENGTVRTVSRAFKDATTSGDTEVVAAQGGSTRIRVVSVYLHAKTAVFDWDVACVGSANMDVRSFKLNFELSCFLQCEELCQRLADLFEKDGSTSKQIQIEDVEKRRYWTQLAEATAHLLSPLL